MTDVDKARDDLLWAGGSAWLEGRTPHSTRKMAEALDAFKAARATAQAWKTNPQGKRWCPMCGNRDIEYFRGDCECRACGRKWKIEGFR